MQFRRNVQPERKGTGADRGGFDALVLALLLMAHFKGQVVVPDCGFYGRDFHIGLIREQRLIAGVPPLGELPVKLRQAVLSLRTKRLGELRAKILRRSPVQVLLPRTVAFNDFVQEAMA